MNNGKITLVSGVDFPLNQSIEILYSFWMFIANHIGEIQNPPYLWGTEMGRKVLEVQVCYETDPTSARTKFWPFVRATSKCELWVAILKPWSCAVSLCNKGPLKTKNVRVGVAKISLSLLPIWLCGKRQKKTFLPVHAEVCMALIFWALFGDGERQKTASHMWFYLHHINLTHIHYISALSHSIHVYH